MPRILFTKTDDAVWMSHLDLMRFFQRSFKRAGLPLTHTQGYSPRPSVSIALPLSVGVESVYELLDFELEVESVACEEITQRLNAVLVPGIRVLETYEGGRKIRDIAYLQCQIMLEYDNGIDDNGVEKIAELFRRDSVIVEKKGKNGTVQQDIIPMIRCITVTAEDAHRVRIMCRICCQNPSLNPNQLVAAIEKYQPTLTPDFVQCRRIEIYDDKETIFR